ncbi:MAG: hypothetical protein IPM29_08860 [Planctomycetes bacterium]|nr:hypothetical protein [Planctomycetota bacterium]
MSRAVLSLLFLLGSAAGLAAQCARPPAPTPTGFTPSLVATETVTYTDGVVAEGALWAPSEAAPSCGWPLVVYVHSLGQNRGQDGPWLARVIESGYAVWAYDVRGQGATRRLNPAVGTTMYGGLERFDLAEQLVHVTTAHVGLIDPDRIALMGDSQGGVHCWMGALQSDQDLTVPGRGTIHFPRIRCVVGADFVPEPLEHRLRGGTLFSTVFLGTLDAPAATGFELTVDPVFATTVFDRFEAGDPHGLDATLRSEPGRDFAASLSTLAVPVLFHHAWHDSVCSTGPLLRAFERVPVTTPVRCVLSTVGHGTASNAYELALKHSLALRWLDRFLWHELNGVDLEERFVLGFMPLDPVQLDDPAYVWPHSYEPALPVPDAAPLRLWLTDGGTLDPVEPPGPQVPARIEHRVGNGLTATVWRTDPQRRRLTSVLQDIALSLQSFEWTLDADRELVGEPELRLRVVPSAPEFTVAALLSARLPGRTEFRLLSHWAQGVRGAVPSTAHDVTFRLSPIATRLPLGTTLRLDLQNLWVPFAPHQVGLVTVPSFVDSDVDVLFGPSPEGSTLELPLRPWRVTLRAPRAEFLVAEPPPELPMELDAGVERAGFSYIVGVSGSGHHPGIGLPGGTLPIVLDIWTELFAWLIGYPELVDFIGVLDAQGHAAPRLDLRGLPSLPVELVGRQFSFAAWVHESPMELRGVPSNPIDVVVR